jgi:hypothetical protein
MVSGSMAVLNSGFIQNTDGFGTFQQDSVKVSSCQKWGWNSPTSAIVRSTTEIDRAQPVMKSLRWMRDGGFESAHDEISKTAMEVKRVLNQGPPNSFHMRPSISDPSTRHHLSNNRLGSASFGYNSPENLDRGNVHRANHRPLLALCFDFDQTLSQAHIHNLKKNSDRGNFIQF